MIEKDWIKMAVLWLVASMATVVGQEAEVPLMRPDEKQAVDRQSAAFNQALSETLVKASKSSVRIWGLSQRTERPVKLAYGTVVGNGRQILTKWSEVEPFLDTIYVQASEDVSFEATVAGVFTDEDLVLLDLIKVESEAASIQDALVPVKFSNEPLEYGRFMTATQPDGKPAAFGVVSVLERNLRETDQAHLGIMADSGYRGKGVRISNVQPEYGAAEAGLQSGDVILDIDGRAISGLQELRNALTNKQPGDQVTLLIDTAGKERSVEVLLSNRPMFGQFSGGRLNQMERMGGEPNRVRSGFSRVVQSDMKIQRNQVGGPVVNLQGEVVGITLARADRTRTYIMAGAAVSNLLEGDLDTVAEAKTKLALKRQELAERRRELMPRMRLPSTPQNPKNLERYSSDLERLLGRMHQELDTLEREPTP